ncbi:HAD family hydrolase [soil metagenome]
MNSKGILLDLDNTLYDYNAAHIPALEVTLTWLARTLKQPHAEVHLAYVECRQRINKDLHGLASSHSRLLYFQGVSEHFGAGPYEIAGQAEDLYWREFFQHMVLRPGVTEFLSAMRSKPIAVVTDLTTRIQFQKITHLKLASSLKAIVTSEEAGHEKPHARIFEIAAAKLQMASEDLCMIGDSWERDIQGALKFGMRCFWFRDGSEKQVAGNDKPNPHNDRPELVTEFKDFHLLTEMINNLV